MYIYQKYLIMTNIYRNLQINKIMSEEKKTHCSLLPTQFHYCKSQTVIVLVLSCNLILVYLLLGSEEYLFSNVKIYKKI